MLKRLRGRLGFGVPRLAKWLQLEERVKVGPFGTTLVLRQVDRLSQGCHYPRNGSGKLLHIGKKAYRCRRDGWRRESSEDKR